MRALKKNKDERYANAKEMRADLKAVFGYRLPALSTDDSSGQIVLPAPEVHNAPTLAADSGSALIKRSVTSDGTEITIPVTSTRRTVAGVVAAIALMGIGAAIFFVTSSHDKKTIADPQADTSASATAAKASAPPIVADPQPSTPASIVTPTSTTNVRGNARGTTTAKTTASSAVAPSASVAIASAAPPASTSSAPPFNPSSSNVVMSRLSTERVQRGAVSAAMSRIAPRLTECYQMELRNLGQPKGGSAEIQLSVDPSGKMQGSVLASGHAEFARCAQGALAGLSVAGSAVEPQGGTATQWLTLNP